MHILAVAWDAMILLLTFVGLRRQYHAWTSPVGMKIRWQGLYYIVVSVVVNFGLIVSEIVDDLMSYTQCFQVPCIERSERYGLELMERRKP